MAGPALAQPFLGFIGQLVEEVANIANFTPIPVAISGSPYLSLLLNAGGIGGTQKEKDRATQAACLEIKDSLREHKKNHQPKILLESAIDVEPGI